MKNTEKQENVEKTAQILTFSSTKHTGIQVPSIIDKKTSKDYILWGEDNKLPNYLWDSYLKCSELQAVIQTIHNYIIGEGIIADYSLLSSEDETIEEVIKRALLDYLIFGGFTLQVTRNKLGNIARIDYQNVMNVRVNEDLTLAYLCNDWGKWTNKDVIEMPLYDKTTKQDQFLFYFRGNITRNINPIPLYISAMKSVEILNNTRNFHLRNLENNFNVSAIVSINGSSIKQRQLDEIEQKLIDGYTGSENAGKFILINNPSEAGSVKVDRLQSSQFGELYKTLQDSSKDDIFTTFRINQLLLGKNYNSGFSAEEFENAYNLFYSSFIKIIQNDFIKQFKKLNVNIEFKPLEIKWKQ